VSSSAIQQVVMFGGSSQSKYAASWWHRSAVPDGGFQIALSCATRAPGSPASALAQRPARSASVTPANNRSAFQTLHIWRVSSGAVTPGV
jgi:hypothetical protein